MPIPAGYSLLTFTWNLSGASRDIVNTWACKNGAHVTPATLNATARTNFVTTAFSAYAAASLCQPYTLVAQKCLMNLGGVLYSDENFTQVAHTGGATPPPMNTAVLVKKVTGIAGRKYRGRVFSPWGTIEANVDQTGTILAGSLATIQTTWTNTFNSMIASGTDLVLLHTDGTVPTALSAVTVSQRCGTIGRRMRG